MNPCGRVGVGLIQEIVKAGREFKVLDEVLAEQRSVEYTKACSILAGDGDDYGNGGGGNDTLVGGAGYDRLSGGDGDDVVIGGTYLDSLYGDAGADSLFGGSERDALSGGAGNDTLDGGSGLDQATYSFYGTDPIVFDASGIKANGAAVTIDAGVLGMDRLVGIEFVSVYCYNGAANDSMTGGAGPLRLG